MKDLPAVVRPDSLRSLGEPALGGLQVTLDTDSAGLDVDRHLRISCTVDPEARVVLCLTYDGVGLEFAFRHRAGVGVFSRVDEVQRCHVLAWFPGRWEAQSRAGNITAIGPPHTCKGFRSNFRRIAILLTR
jgi:hypothetical protein